MRVRWVVFAWGQLENAAKGLNCKLYAYQTVQATAGPSAVTNQEDLHEHSTLDQPLWTSLGHG